VTAAKPSRLLSTTEEIERAGLESSKGKRLDPEIAQRLIVITAPALAALMEWAGDAGTGLPGRPECSGGPGRIGLSGPARAQPQRPGTQPHRGVPEYRHSR
jgi:hypothetical protein